MVAGVTKSMARHLSLAVATTVMLVVLASNAAAQAESSATARLDRLERALDNKGLLDLVRQVELLQQEVRQLRGELENQIFALEQQRKSQRDTYVDIDRRLGTLEQGGIISVPPGTAAGRQQLAADPPLPMLSAPGDSTIAGPRSDQAIAVDVTPAAPSAAIIRSPSIAGTQSAASGQAVFAPDDTDSAAFATPGNAPAMVVDVPTPSLRPRAPTVDSAASEAAYRDAFALLKAGQYEESITQFKAYLQAYPSSQYADNAQYWLGEAHYVMRQFEPAIGEYQKLVQTYPDSKKQSHALLKIAYSYNELGQIEQSMRVLGDLKARFPGSAAARLADERMQRIRASAP